jgi:hypothetical protein
MNLFLRAVNTVNVWALASQHQARRNAMIASTRLAQRRAERIDVEEFLARAADRRAADGTSPAPAARG